MQHLNEALALRQLRLEEGWTYRELADRIGGLDTSTVQRFIESPARRIHETTLFKIRRFLDTRRPGAGRRRRMPASARQVSS